MCAETANKKIRAYAAAFMEQIMETYDGCEGDQQRQVKTEILRVIGRFKELIEEEIDAKKPL